MLHDFNLKKICFIQLFVLKIFHTFVALESWHSKKAQMLLILINFKSRPIFCQVWILRPKSHSKRLCFSKNTGKNYQFFCIGILMDHKCQNRLWYEFFSLFKLMFLQSNWLNFFYHGLKFFFRCFGKVLLKLLIWFQAVELWWIRSAESCYCCWHACVFGQNFHLCFTWSFFFKESIVNFFTWGGHFAFKKMNVVLYIGIKMLVGQKWQGCY